MTISFYVDEDIMRKRLIQALRSAGLDVVSPSEAGMLHRLDEEHLAFATQQGRVIYSFNVADFCRLHGEWMRLGKLHAGILLAHQWRRHSIGLQRRALLRLSAHKSREEMQNQLEYLNDWI